MLVFGVSFITGGSQHGFAAVLGDYSIVWKASLATTAAALLLVLMSTAFAMLQSVPRTILIWTAVLGFGAYLIFLTSVSDLFVYLLYYSFPALLVLLLLSSWRWWRHGDTHYRWFVFAVLITFGGAVVQMSEVSLHTHFNHNDLFHVIQLAGLVLFYRGAALTRDL